ncbi:MarR family winged helix-turn-helix transcriptional regulator [Streptomyces sp. NPDC086549]|uniref:MarR family winged helix-turn-helix transcriptional regulator n=1 Tax=Streptomyces sp. NPDC086549 TaxID=3365752 RepID=UPI0037F988F0
MTQQDQSSRHAVGQQLSFALYGAANRMVRAHKPYLAPLGLTFPQYLALLELYSGTPRSVGELGEKLGMDTGTITPLVKRLEALGMVTRTRDPRDERRVLVDLTPDGEAIREDVWRVVEQVDALCESPEFDLDELRDLLDSLVRPSGFPAADRAANSKGKQQ